MNVFDFDKTIFHGDSTAKFYKYCLKRYPKMWIHIPSMACAFAKYYVFKKGTKTQCKEKFYRFLTAIPNVDEAVDKFWEKNIDGVFEWYKEIKKETDVIISASPEFLLEGVCKKLGAEKMMASKVDKKTGKYNGENCHGEEKVRRFYEAYPDGVIDNFYSDSVSDAPLARISKQAFVIDKKGKVLEWEKVFSDTEK